MATAEQIAARDAGIAARRAAAAKAEEERRARTAATIAAREAANAAKGVTNSVTGPMPGIDTSGTHVPTYGRNTGDAINVPIADNIEPPATLPDNSNPWIMVAVIGSVIALYTLNRKRR